MKIRHSMYLPVTTGSMILINHWCRLPCPAYARSLSFFIHALAPVLSLPRLDEIISIKPTSPLTHDIIIQERIDDVLYLRPACPASRCPFQQNCSTNCLQKYFMQQRRSSSTPSKKQLCNVLHVWIIFWLV